MKEREGKSTADTFVISEVMCSIRLLTTNASFFFRCNLIIRSLDCYIKRELRENFFHDGYAMHRTSFPLIPTLIFPISTKSSFILVNWKFSSMNVVRSAGGDGGGSKNKFKFDHGKIIVDKTSLFVRTFLKITVISS